MHSDGLEKGTLVIFAMKMEVVESDQVSIEEEDSS